MRNNGSPDPVFETDEDRTWFRVTLPIHPDFIQDEDELVSEPNVVKPEHEHKNEHKNEHEPKDEPKDEPNNDPKKGSCLKEGQKLIARAKRIGYQISEATEWTSKPGQ